MIIKQNFTFTFRDGNSLENFTPWVIKEWQFNIPWGLRKIKSIPQGPRGISGNMIFLNLHTYYIQEKTIFFFHFTQFKEISCEISNFLTYFECPHLWMRKSEKIPGIKLATTIYSRQVPLSVWILKKSWFSNFWGPQGIWRGPQEVEEW